MLWSSFQCDTSQTPWIMKDFSSHRKKAVFSWISANRLACTVVLWMLTLAASMRESCRHAPPFPAHKLFAITPLPGFAAPKATHRVQSPLLCINANLAQTFYAALQRFARRSFELQKTSKNGKNVQWKPALCIIGGGKQSFYTAAVVTGKKTGQDKP